MPAHARYVEPFLGGGYVLDRKKPAASTLAADMDADVVAYHKAHALSGVEYRVADAFDLLASLDLGPADLVYLDPPYHPSTRSKRRLYRHELTDADHSRLLALVLSLRCQVMLSGYRCALYDEALKGWYREDFTAMTRGGPRTESVWCNFTPGETFHDTRYVGGNFRERERIKRKRARWVRRLLAMPAAERAVIVEAVALSTAAAGAGARP